MPIIGCVLLTAGMVLMGMARIIVATSQLVRDGDLSSKAAKMASLAVIEIIDLFLIDSLVGLGVDQDIISTNKISAANCARIEAQSMGG